MTTMADATLDQLADALLPRLLARGVLVRAPEPSAAGSYDADYDDATCAQFLNPAHLGDSVLERASVFFEALDRMGEIGSPDLVQLLGVKGPTSIPANLTIALKKRARKLAIPVPWSEATTRDNAHIVWRNRDGIAARMVRAISEEKARRGLA
jgi:hypothetical protein